MSNNYANNFVNYQHEDRQWDARFNVQLESDLRELLENAKREWDSGKLKYILIGGVEIGTKEFQDDFKIQHVHCAFIYVNRVSKKSVLKNLGIKEGNGYYLVPRNRSLPYSGMLRNTSIREDIRHECRVMYLGWRNHHTKEYSKANPASLVLFEMGTLPEDLKKQNATSPYTKRSDEEKKRNIDAILIEMRELIEAGKDKEAWEKFPRTFLQYGEKLKALIHQKKDKLQASGQPNIWLHGSPGAGKTAILSYIYPTTYKKNLYNRFFDLYDDKVHSHVMLEDLDHEAVERLSVNFLKTLCDEAGFAIDQKYKTPQLTRSTILITSNFSIHQVIDQADEINVYGKPSTKQALLRRFWHVEAREFMRILGLKIISKYEIQQLKKQGNTDPGRLFYSWDYLTDTPTGEPIKSPEHYQGLIRDTYYGA